jgi:hypothetical protein
MARGWESKNIEDQISAAEAKQEARSKTGLTLEAIEQQRLQESLLLERTRILREIQGAHNKRYLAILQNSLHHIETELGKLPSGKSTTAHANSK